MKQFTSEFIHIGLTLTPFNNWLNNLLNVTVFIHKNNIYIFLAHFKIQQILT